MAIEAKPSPAAPVDGVVTGGTGEHCAPVIRLFPDPAMPNSRRCARTVVSGSWLQHDNLRAPGLALGRGAQGRRDELRALLARGVQRGSFLCLIRPNIDALFGGVLLHEGLQVTHFLTDGSDDLNGREKARLIERRQKPCLLAHLLHEDALPIFRAIFLAQQG